MSATRSRRAVASDGRTGPPRGRSPIQSVQEHLARATAVQAIRDIGGLAIARAPMCQFNDTGRRRARKA